MVVVQSSFVVHGFISAPTRASSKLQTVKKGVRKESGAGKKATRLVGNEREGENGRGNEVLKKKRI